MKKLLVFIMALLMSAGALADTYVGIYGVSTKTNESTAGDYSKEIANIAFGQNMNSGIGLGYEVFFNQAGLGGSVEAFTTISHKYKVSIGRISVPENSSRSPVSGWPESSSNAKGQGGYIGLSTKLSGNKYLSIKYIRYDVDHSFFSEKQTGVDESDNTPIFTNKSGYGAASREQIWVGVTFHI